MHDLKVIKKRVQAQGKPPCEAKEFYSINGESWMTYSQYFHWKEALVSKSWKNYSAFDIKKQVEACLVAYNKELDEDLVDVSLLDSIEKALLHVEEGVLNPCDIVYNIMCNCTK